MEIVLNTSFRKWFQSDNCYSIGYAFIENNLLEDFQLCSYLYQKIEQNSLHRSLCELNGTFAAIIKYQDYYYLITDQIRSFPLLYGKIGNRYFISDSIFDIEEYLKGEDVDNLAVAEFYAMGYLSGSKTLFTQIKNVEAGTYIIFSETTAKIIEYHRHIYPKLKERNDDILIDFGQDILEKAFARMLYTIGTRQIVIPLSGGYDSRVIACLCKKFNVVNVVCFTYGPSNSPEIGISEKVARSLGFEWYYVEYTGREWLDIYDSKEYNNYLKFAGNLNAEPCIQDFFAIKELLRKKIINENAVVVPGHSADLLGGSHLPKSYSYSLWNLLYDKYYNANLLRLRYERKLKRELREKFRSKSHSKEDFLNEFNNWGIKVRQSHFVINSVRLYEYFGLDWRLPLWDSEFSKFWNSIPWDKKENSYLYHYFLFEKYFNKYNVAIYKKKDVENACSILLCKILPYWLWFIMRRIKKVIVKDGTIDINSFSALIDIYKETCDKDRKFLKKRYSTINSYLPVYYVQMYKILAELNK